MSTIIQEVSVFEGHNLNGLFNNTLKEMMSLLDAECGSLFLFDPQNNELILDSFYNSNTQFLKGHRQKAGEGVSGKVLNIKLPVLVKDINSDVRFRRNGFKHYHTNSFISIPLICAHGILGLVNIADKADRQCFTEKDFEIAKTLCKFVCIAADNILLTERLKQEKDSAERQKKEFEKLASVGKVAAGIVHEINNPLDGIIRFTHILLVHLDNNPTARDYLLEIKKGLDRITKITKSLLIFSHQSGTSAFFQLKKYIDLHAVIEGGIDAYKDSLEGMIKVEKKFDEIIPRVADFGLAHIVTNIIKNAIDAMPDGGTLTISTCLKTSGVSIVFADTGVGMTESVRERIFEPFFTTKSIDKGTGLGLAICKEIVTKYEGDITIETAPGKGSAVTVFLPSQYLEHESASV
ncbi:MAG: GAF domain-containing sensor histidine kinase [Candidatus Omnitrophica bacterium]|nr:GAF domain-containing sensor histidine kinase [Candidatus Omnitrophota bacterium]